MLKNLEIEKQNIDLYSFTFESDSINFDGVVNFDSVDERGQTVVEWADFVPNDWENVEELLIASCL